MIKYDDNPHFVKNIKPSSQIFVETEKSNFYY